MSLDKTDKFWNISYPVEIRVTVDDKVEVITGTMTYYSSNGKRLRLNMDINSWGQIAPFELTEYQKILAKMKDPEFRKQYEGNWTVLAEEASERDEQEAIMNEHYGEWPDEK